MQLFSAEESAHSPYPGKIHPKLTSFAGEFCATLARLFAYVGVLALVGILGTRAWDELLIDLAADAPPRAGLECHRPVLSRIRAQPARCRG